MSYRVCIPTAGTGSRLGDLTRFVNKSLISIANRPIISHIIEQFPEDTEFVIALGHKGHLVREFLELAYPSRKFFYVSVSPYEGEGSGLGWSLLQCKAYLQQPFVFVSCDTLVQNQIPNPDHNWMGYAEGHELCSYRTLKIVNDVVTSIHEKGEDKASEDQPYIGLAGIQDYNEFWKAMESEVEEAIPNGEAYGFRRLIEYDVRAYRFTWFDTGNPAALNQTRNAYQNSDGPNILEKANEAIWFVDDSVIKFSDDTSFIANRVKRASLLEGFIPQVTDTHVHMYRYTKVCGKVLSEVINLPLFERFLVHSRHFWKEAELSQNESAEFKTRCYKFYRDKTLERVNLFYQNSQHRDGNEPINGYSMPTLAQLLNELDWDWLSEGLPGRFHGDFHFENILWSEKTQEFTFLDWRQDFGGLLEIGDIYYDLAKLMHGLIINHEIIAKDLYWVKLSPIDLSFDFNRKQILVECEKRYNLWLEECGFSIDKVWILTALIFLNIAALHHEPYNKLLYALGKFMIATFPQRI